MGKNGVEVLHVDNIKWLNENNIEEQLGYSTLRTVTRQYSSKLRKQRQELKDKVLINISKRRFWNSSNNGLQNSKSSRV